MNHPLLCWDICQEGINRRIALKYDLAVLKKIVANKIIPYDASPENALVWENRVIIITDLKLHIVHATENIYSMNGYLQKEVIGKRPAIFQGEKTEAGERKKIREAIVHQRPFESTITNYKKDGSIYKCHIEGFPLFNKQGTIVHFVAMEKAVS